MATGQCFRLVTTAAAPDGADGVDNVFRSETTTRSGNGFARRKASLTLDDRLAGFEDGGTSGAMDSSVYAASAHQRRVSGVDDGVTGFASNIAGTGDHERALRGEREEDAQELGGIRHGDGSPLIVTAAMRRSGIVLIPQCGRNHFARVTKYCGSGTGLINLI